MRTFRHKHLDEYREFLDNLKESGVTNMFGAAPYLQKAFPRLTNKEAMEVLGDWMLTFSERHPKATT